LLLLWVVLLQAPTVLPNAPLVPHVVPLPLVESHSCKPEPAAWAVGTPTNPVMPEIANTAAATTPEDDFLPRARLVSAAATTVPVFAHQMLLYDLFIRFSSSQ
jgi:hypothetical protein